MSVSERHHTPVLPAHCADCAVHRQVTVRFSTLVQQRGLSAVVPDCRHTRSAPTAVVAPSVLDALEFDLTVEDSTGSDEGSQMPVPQSRPLAFAPEADTMMADSRRGHPFRRLVLVGTQHDSIPPTELDQVRDTALDGSDTDIAEPPAVAESDTESLGHNSDVAGGEVPDPSTQSETEVVIPVPPTNNRGFSMADFGQTDFGQPSLASPFWRPTLAKPTLVKPTLAKVKVLVVCKDFGFWELIVCVF